MSRPAAPLTPEAPPTRRPIVTSAIVAALACTTALCGCAAGPVAHVPHSAHGASGASPDPSGDDVVPLSATVPPDATHFQLSYEPGPGWKQTPSGASDMISWSHTSTGCTLSQLSTADYKPSNDEQRSRKIIDVIAPEGTPLPGGATTVRVPRRGSAPVEFAARQAKPSAAKDGTSSRTTRSVAARAFTNMGGYLVLELTCPSTGTAVGTDLPQVLTQGSLVGVG